MELALIIGVCLLVAYFGMEKFEGLKKKSTDELLSMMLPESDSRYYHRAGKELQQRGENILRYIELFPPMMESSDKRVQMMGWITFQKLYPELAADISVPLSAGPEAYLAAAKTIRERHALV